VFDRLAFDPFALFEDGFGPAEVGVGRSDVVEALVVAPVIVVLDEGPDLAFEVARQEVVFEQDAVLEGLVPALNLALGLGMHRSATDVAHGVGMDVVGQFAGNVTRAIVAEQARLMLDVGLIAA
jgi:hypothetical protein